MSQPYIGEIRIFAGNFAPVGWLFCEGQLLSIAENEVLFQLIGTTYGGDGESTFALPDLQGRLPLHQGNGFLLAETGGAEDVTLTLSQIPAHSHAMMNSSGIGKSSSPKGGVLANSSGKAFYGVGGTVASLAPETISPVGGSQPHTNMQPYLCVNFIISLFGIFPTPN